MTVPDEEDKSRLRRIMVVDDSRLMRRAVSKILGPLYDVVQAADGQEAWEMLRADETVELVCCDLSMPVLDGFGFLALVRGADDERIRDTPVVIVTGAEDTEENRNKIFNQGAADFVSKPFDSVQLKARVKVHLSQIETVRQLEDRAATDPVTGLGSREFFLKAGQQRLSYALREGHSLAVVQFTIDDFRSLFMRVGRSGVAVILKAVGEAISRQARQEDMLCRVGLDSFAGLLHTQEPEGAARMASRVLKAVSNITVNVKEKPVRLSVSIGLMPVRNLGATQVAELLKAARDLVQRAQQAGGNRIATDVEVPVAETPSAKKPEALTVEQALAQIERGETGEVGGQIESLVRRVLPLLSLYEQLKRRGLGDALEALKRSVKG